MCNVQELCMKKIDIDEQRKNHVVKSNELMQKATFNLTAMEQKFIAYVISQIKPTDKELQFYEIKVLDFAELCGIHPKNVYTEFKEMIDTLDNKCAWIINEKEPGVIDDAFKFRWFSESEYSSKGTIRVLLNSKIKKHLLDLINQGHYTQYELYNVLGLKSKYSIRLYELLRSYVKANETKGSVQYDIQMLKELLSAESYKSFTHFRDRVIDRGLLEINEHTDLIVDSILLDSKGNKIQASQGKKVCAIRFIIKRRDDSDRFFIYQKTVEAIKKRNQQIKGQMEFDENGIFFET